MEKKGAETLARDLAIEIEEAERKGKRIKVDWAITLPETQELAERIQNARTEGEADRIARTIHKQYPYEIENHWIDSLIWDYGIDWDKIKWEPKETGYRKYEKR